MDKNKQEKTTFTRYRMNLEPGWNSSFFALRLHENHKIGRILDWLTGQIRDTKKQILIINLNNRTN